MTAYYNEHDPYAANWLRNLIAAGHIAPGIVDERDIRDITPDELREFTQCHFFAGIGVWSHALRRAGWSDDRPIWTGSCPCQPFSAAGKRAGTADERHLWPHWFHLIAECRPPVVLGEQVAGALDWLDLVSADMEGAGYALGASDLCAAGFGGAHIRQRLYFAGVGQADSDHARLEGRRGVPERADQRAARQGGVAGGVDNAASTRHQRAFVGAEGDPRDEAWLRLSGAGCGFDGMAIPRSEGRQQVGSLPGGGGEGSGAAWLDERSGDGGALRGLADTHGGDTGAERQQSGGQHGQQPQDGGDGHGLSHAPLLGRNAADWLYCRDGKWRPVEPGLKPLADAAPARVGRLRAYGNALDAETAAEFVSAVMDCL